MKLVGLSILFLLGTVGCGETPKAGERSALRIAAASDLQVVLPALGDQFRQESGLTIVATYGASGTLAEQIKNGAPYDVFLSADLGFVEVLASGAAVKPDSVRPYAIGMLALVVAKTNTSVNTIKDLSRSDVKTFVLANPSYAPYGVAAKQAIEHSNLWDALEPKRVLASNVREALQFVESGNADVAFVGLSAVRESQSLRAIPIEPVSYKPIVQGLGIVADTERADDAEAFTRFLLGESGQAILKAHGFGPAPSVPVQTK